MRAISQYIKGKRETNWFRKCSTFNSLTGPTLQLKTRMVLGRCLVSKIIKWCSVHCKLIAVVDKIKRVELNWESLIQVLNSMPATNVIMLYAWNVQWRNSANTLSAWSNILLSWSAGHTRISWIHWPPFQTFCRGQSEYLFIVIMEFWVTDLECFVHW